MAGVTMPDVSFFESKQLAFHLVNRRIGRRDHVSTGSPDYHVLPLFRRSLDFNFRFLMILDVYPDFDGNQPLDEPWQLPSLFFQPAMNITRQLNVPSGNEKFQSLFPFEFCFHSPQKSILK